jgi:hypothetical protein
MHARVIIRPSAINNFSQIEATIRRGARGALLSALKVAAAAASQKRPNYMRCKAKSGGTDKGQETTPFSLHALVIAKKQPPFVCMHLL